MSEATTVFQALAAFKAATGMGVRVCRANPKGVRWTCENPFCHIMQTWRVPGTPCRPSRSPAFDTGNAPPLMRRCAAGLEHIVIPLPGEMGAAGWVESGQVFLSPPQPEDFNRLLRRLPTRGCAVSVTDLRKAFFATPVLTRVKLQAAIELLRLITARFALPRGNEDVPAQPLTGDPVSAIRSFVKQHVDGPIRLADVAARVGLSPAYVCRLFKQRTGQTLGEHIATQRTERAKHLLVHRRDRIVDVAFAAGFESVRQFNHVFKARTQLTPREFRQSVESPPHTA